MPPFGVLDKQTTAPDCMIKLRPRPEIKPPVRFGLRIAFIQSFRFYGGLHNSEGFFELIRLLLWPIPETNNPTHWSTKRVFVYLVATNKRKHYPVVAFIRRQKRFSDFRTDFEAFT